MASLATDAQPSEKTYRMEIVINLKTGKGLGPSVLARLDEVVE
jgi:hypothetical protein